uniref:Putative secreted protein n=1 Tax=Ixodes ricinus TaxID=34613 RepID=A0A6B0U2Q0_IXORI
MKCALPLSTSGAGVFQVAVAGVRAAAAGRWSGKGGPVKKCQEKQKKITRKKNSKKKNSLETREFHVINAAA